MHHTVNRSRLMLLAVVAILVAFAGSASAGALITGKKIKDGSVTGVDLRDESVTGVDIQDRSLNAEDFNGSVRGPAGEAGPRGPEGPAGPQGARGPNGVGGLQSVMTPRSISGSTTTTYVVHCPADKKVVGGGVSSASPFYLRINESAPLDQNVGWLVTVTNELSQTLAVYVWAVCVLTS